MQAAERLEESIQLLQKARPYFTMEPTPECACPECSEKNPEGERSDDYNKPALLKLTVDVSQSYFDIGLGQFDGFIHQQGKQVFFLGISVRSNMFNDTPHDIWFLLRKMEVVLRSYFAIWF